MKLLVVEATGDLGSAIVHAALTAGHDVSVLVPIDSPTRRKWPGTEGVSPKFVSASGGLGDQVGTVLAGETFDAVAVAVGAQPQAPAQAADAVRATINAVAAAEPSPVLLMTGGAPALILRPGNSCVDKCFGGAAWAKELRDFHLRVTFAALQASTIPTWTMVCPGTMIHKAEGARSFHRTQPEIIDESVAGASLLYSAVAQAYVDVGMELVKKGAKSKYNKVGDSASLEVPLTASRVVDVPAPSTRRPRRLGSRSKAGGG
jgi:putative NADH-flavin reductase